MIALPARMLEQIRSHAAASYPEECCGGLLGRRQDGDDDIGDARVVRVERVDNRQTDQRERRYTIDPRDYLRLERLAAESDLSVLGIYHSHPDHPAVPSEYDREHALPFFHYVIVAVEGGRAGEVASWVLSQERTFEREPHRLSDDDEE